MRYKGADIQIPTRIGVTEEREGPSTGHKLALRIDNLWYHAKRVMEGHDRHWDLTEIRRVDAPQLYDGIVIGPKSSARLGHLDHH